MADLFHHISIHFHTFVVTTVRNEMVVRFEISISVGKKYCVAYNGSKVDNPILLLMRIAMDLEFG
jgi:hypothetical protein